VEVGSRVTDTRAMTATMNTTPSTAAEVVRSDLDDVVSRCHEEFAALSGRRVLLTGGAGFLGYYLVQSMMHFNDAAAGERIHLTVYDNYARGVPQWLSDFAARPDLELVEHDVRNPLPDAIGDYQYIIHAAGIASPTYYRLHPIETMDANVNGLRHLLDYSKQQRENESPIEGFLFFSSSEIYGDPQPDFIPTPEAYRGNVSCTGPRACYDESKRYGETLCVNFAQVHDLPVKMVRPFNNYGPGLKITDRRVLPDFARDVLSGRDVTLLSDGSATRTFCYVADAITGYIKVLVKGAPGEAYNIGVEEPEISIGDVAELVVQLAAELFSYHGTVVKRVSDESDYLTDNPNRRCPVIQKARAHVGYDPKVQLRDGLRRMLIWYSDNRRAEDA
jgi:UDP-glucuronate decarboxylase